jgi:hypothetical protein
MRQRNWFVGILPTQDGAGKPEVFLGNPATTPDFLRAGGWGGYVKVTGPYATLALAVASSLNSIELTHTNRNGAA